MELAVNVEGVWVGGFTLPEERYMKCSRIRWARTIVLNQHFIDRLPVVN